MSLQVGVLVEQMHRGKYRQGVIYKKKLDPNTGIIPWAYFEVLWATGVRSTERSDQIKLSPNLSNQFNDLIVLKDLQDSINAGASYD